MIWYIHRNHVKFHHPSEHCVDTYSTTEQKQSHKPTNSTCIISYEKEVENNSCVERRPWRPIVVAEIRRNTTLSDQKDETLLDRFACIISSARVQVWACRWRDYSDPAQDETNKFNPNICTCSFIEPISWGLRPINWSFRKPLTYYLSRWIVQIF